MKNVRVWFEKKGAARYISHLDLTRNMARGLKLSGLPVWYTEGFNPRIYMTYAMPLSLGVCGERECMDIRLTEEVPYSELTVRLNTCLPRGLRALEAGEPAGKFEEIQYGESGGRSPRCSRGKGLQPVGTGDSARAQAHKKRRQGL